MKETLKIPVLLAAIVYAVIVSGVTVSLYWGWFLAPATGLANIGYAEGAGIYLLFSFFSARYSKTEPGEVAKNIVYTIMKPLWFLLLGWIVAGFV